MKVPENLEREVIDDVRRLKRGGADLEMILLFFREKGFDKIDSIQAMRALYGKSINEAKDIIDNSHTWSHRFRTDTELREMALKALREIAASHDPRLPKIIIEGDAD